MYRFFYTLKCYVNQLCWQKGENTTNGIGVWSIVSKHSYLLFPVLLTLVIASWAYFHYFSLWHYQNPIRYKKRKNWTQKKVEWESSSGDEVGHLLYWPPPPFPCGLIFEWPPSGTAFGHASQNLNFWKFSFITARYVPFLNCLKNILWFLD